MITIYDLKPKFQAMLRPIVHFLFDRGITPNQVTVTALLLSILTGLLIAFSHGAIWTLLLVPIIMFVRMAMNAIDGILAREHDMKTKLGALLNELSDVVSDAALYLPLAYINGVSPVLTVLFVLFAILTEMTGVLSVVMGNERAYDGPMGKSDRAFLVGFICLILGIGVSASWWVNVLLIVAIVLETVTVINRAKKALL
ncbi:CDP-alcohol phosphatidyltransferase family protein [Sulfurovum sp.]|uniref:CDP-alcohol phosphatidyltransferase family protein n=1 Tax=Sulfurovum sp. TaxID=1969726 RepID=UPI00356634F6